MYFEDKRILAGIAGAIIVSAGAGFEIARWTADPAAPAEQAANAQETAHADRLALSADAIRNAGIGVEEIRAGGLGSEIVAQAMVAPSPSGEAVVTARAGGAVTRVFKRLGDPVRAGEALAIVESRDAAQIASERTAAAARATLAERNLARERYLYEQKVSARAEYESAQAEAAAAAAEARRAQAAAGAANVTSDGRGTVVASPISGRVTAESVMLGAFVQPEAELFRVADPRLVQVEASVGPADMARLAAGDRAVIELPDGKMVEGRVRSVTPTLSGDTRAATAVIDVTGGMLQPGLGVRVRLYPSVGAPSSAIVVPEDALQSVDGKDAVFIRTSQGFRAQFVTIGQRSAGRVEILSGLKPGQLVATKNAFLLKAELGKGAGEEE
ncbi:efflux RND transporter periplasmic adaptor subunit [Novosphingobium cyanobacteriorum]|uniref:Efflux RND transporter periplasmic adaptor subunit n=1 Tax=Novosphingobium cyanobacteriorum TaxID=3024215 RepID=A0ABT6CNL9_9SPHN|nr:efflux RND transporter periplasmic adaptor subunit [Novosphingobium cyanobacteriorum]MDF8335457.1 efflux RND transporter periplasmic adaptor subunit [Novosphingobium cyanobacteriorum]